MPLNSYKKNDLNETKNSKITKFFIDLHYGPLRPGKIGIVNRGTQDPGEKPLEQSEELGREDGILSQIVTF